MAAAFKTGQRLQGLLGTYTLLKNLEKSVWTAAGDTNAGTVIVKSAPIKRLNNEREMLKRFKGNRHIRPLLDEIEEPPALVLKFLHDNLLSASNTRRLERSELRFVARGVLEALNVIHEAGYVHTDIKPNNILANYGDDGGNRFSEVELGDCEDIYRVDPNADVFEEGHIIGAAIFRSPEANLQLRWGTPTDIWSFGATLISLIFGQNWHIFVPKGLSVDDEEYPAQVLIKQASMFGPFPLSYIDIADDERQGVLADISNYIMENELRKPFSMAVDKELTVEDRDFICKIMKMDPRDRPTAKELLEDPWFS